MRITRLKKKLVHPFAKRFYAGETLPDALARAKEVNNTGIGGMLDFLGEDVKTRTEADAAFLEYSRIQEETAARGLDCSLAVKLTHIGLDIDPAVAAEYAVRLGEAAHERGLGLWLDMEGSAHTSKTIDIYRDVRRVHPGAGIALQAYLRRSWDDIKALTAEGAKIRLVKGAYDEPKDIALSRMADIRQSFVEMMEYLFAEAGSFAIGTHDRGIIDAAVRISRDVRCDIEFQMLMGMRDDIKAALVSEGRRVVEYIPYGYDWYGYGMRRLTEKKRNAAYFAWGLLGR